MTAPYPDEAVRAVAEVVYDEGLTCEYHDMSDVCSQCDAMHDALARAVLTAAMPVLAEHFAQAVLAADLSDTVPGTERERLARVIRAAATPTEEA